MNLSIAPIFFTLVFLVSSGCSDKQVQSEAMLKENLECPDNAVAEYSAWGGGGKSGWAHSCKLKHGKFTVWVAGKKIVEGGYVNGLKHGVWTYSDDQGNITSSVTYENGKKVDDIK